MKKILLIVVILLLGYCAKTPEDTRFPDWMDEEMKDFILANSGEFKGWLNVKWSQDLLANIGSIQDANTDSFGKQETNKLNMYFKNTSSQGPSEDIGAYYDSGIFVHGWDEYDTPGSLISPKKEYTASSYVRADISKNMRKPIYNDSFHRWSLGEPSAGIIYKNLDNSNNKYMINCLYSKDGNTLARFLGCNNTSIDINNGKANDYKKEVEDIWNGEPKQSINVCSLEGINTMQSYLELAESKDRHLCSLSGASKKDFQFFVDYYKQVSPQNVLDWNEVVLRFLGSDITSSYRESIAAFFYLNSEKDSYYSVPKGSIKKYNIHLAEAQKQQKLSKDAGLFIPIVEIDMDALRNGGSPFNFYLEDQVVSK